MKDLLLVILALILSVGLNCLVLKFICFCFGIGFNLKYAIGFIFLIVYVKNIFKKSIDNN